MKIVSIVGARPQFIKAAPVCRELRQSHREILVHTGQHYDANMSSIFFADLNIPKPDYSLRVGSGSHGEQTGKMIAKIEEVFLKEKPDWVLVYGDTNSTLAGALAAAKLHIPIIHIEAGLRSYNRKMPEEINRVLADNMSTILACPTKTAVGNLDREGFSNVINQGQLLPIGDQKFSISTEHPLVVNIGDVMYDALLYNIKLAEEKVEALSSLGLAKENYFLATVHRAENTDCLENLESILKRLAVLDKKIILPLHPRTKNKIKDYGLTDLLKSEKITTIEPIGYLEMLVLIKNAYKVITDSGGVQKEAFMLDIPCITLRDETEWVETVKAGWNVLAGLGGRRLEELQSFIPQKEKPFLYGDGRAALRIAKLLVT